MLVVISFDSMEREVNAEMTTKILVHSITDCLYDFKWVPSSVK